MSRGAPARMASPAEKRGVSPKFDQAAAERVAGVRRRNGYYPLDGKLYASVTAVLDALHKPSLIPWAAKTAAALVLADPYRYSTAEAAAGAIYQARDKAADRGSMVHSLAESLGSGAEIRVEELPESVRGYARAFLAFASLTRPETLFTECNIYSDKYGYAGTSDHIGKWADGLTHIADFKTGKAIYREAHLQVAAYRNGDFILTRDGQRVPLPAIEAADVVLLCDDGTFKMERVNAPLKVFLDLKSVWEWSNTTS